MDCAAKPGSDSPLRIHFCHRIFDSKKGSGDGFTKSYHGLFNNIIDTLMVISLKEEKVKQN